MLTDSTRQKSFPTDEIYRYLHAENIHIMTHAGRLRISLHGYNAMADVDKFLQKLEEALSHVGSG